MSEFNFYIDPTLIVNKNIFESIQDVSICCICTGVVVDPLQCYKCENCFCKICIEKWKLKSDSCPYKCENWVLKEPLRIVKKILFRIILKCPKNCMSTLRYEDIFNHVKYCTSQIVDCPTCGSKVSDKLIEKDKFIQLKIENETLKKRILELEKLNLNKNTLKIKDDYNIINTISIFDEKNLKVNPNKFNKKINKFSQNSIINNKNNFSIHDINPKVLFRFSCCGKEYECVNCHNENEHHPYQNITNLTCQECFYISQIISDLICQNCGINFVREDSNVKIPMIKYKNLAKTKHNEEINENYNKRPLSSKIINKKK